jgi:formamidopyrimidine-DNA glycosylase
MPELPEVETIVRSLAPRLRGLEIESSQLLLPRLLRSPENSVLEELYGRKVLGLRRRGKMILIDCEGDRSLLLHLKMTGQLLFSPAQEPPDKHTHLILRFREREDELRFRDVRKFGFVRYLRTSEAPGCRELRDLGPEPLGLDFKSFHEIMRSRKGRLKSLLLNQTIMAGIGNIYADEILFEARIHPQTPACRLKPEESRRLWKAMQAILRKAVASRGSTIRDFLDSEGKGGSFQDQHKVYGRPSEPCPRCGRKIQRLRLGGRSTFFCPRCQKQKLSSPIR